MPASLAVVLCLGVVAAGRAAGSASKAQLIGSWKLISFELRVPSGEVVRPYGGRPIGRILYQKNGEMSAQLMAAGPAPFGNQDPLKATAEETDRAWRSYLGYWGKFEVDSASGTVVHHIEGSSFPNWIGQDQIRTFRFEGDRLILEADSPAWHAALVWYRLN
jgi:hypothetical protein